MSQTVTLYDVLLAVVNLVQTCFLAYLAFRARPSGPLERSEDTNRKSPRGRGTS